MKYHLTFRHPRTRNEMWQYAAATLNEHNIPVRIRGRRRPRHLPTLWDDPLIHRERNWKRHRRTQWRR